MRLLFLAAALFAASAAHAGILLDMQREFNALAEKAKPAVVNIQVEQERDFRAITPEYYFYGIPEQYAPVYRQKLSGIGSGFIISEDGYVLTNAHVVSQADTMKVTLARPDGKEASYVGKLVGMDPYLDLALLKVDPREKLPFLELGDSDKAQAGDWAVAIGSPFGLQQTLTVGVISAVRQRIRIDDRVFKNVLQTDASINRGNSGGPLLNVSGQVIGMNTAIFSPSGASAGIGFAIPASEIRKSLDRLKKGLEAAAPGWAGVALAPLDSVLVRVLGLPSVSGALIQSVVEGSPAQAAGLEHGDVIASVDGNQMSSPEQVSDYIGALKAGDKAVFGLYRKGGLASITVALSARPSSIMQAARPKPSVKKTVQWEGLELGPAAGGMEVRAIRRDSPLAEHLQPGDVVVGVNGAKTPGEAAFVKAVRAASLKDGVLFDLLRDGIPLYISVQKAR
ncbi:MAG: PDZ domain-containing protein [Elusimicrobia bacterium]|nr:PDZ domain-containing protein [Elusimicrobiota bacterium]